MYHKIPYVNGKIPNSLKAIFNIKTVFIKVMISDTCRGRGKFRFM